MPTAYTQRFVLWDGPAGEANYVVPAGMRIIARSIIVWADSTGAGINLLVDSSFLVWLWSAPGPYTATAAQMHLVLYAGEVLRVVRNGAARTGGQIAGYIFEDTVGPRGEQTDHSYDYASELPAVPVPWTTPS